MSKNTYIPPSKVCSTSAFQFNTYVVRVASVPTALAVTIHIGQNINSFVQIMNSTTLVYRIDLHARLLILRKKSPLHGLILVCTIIDFEEKFPPARLFIPARLFGTLEYWFDNLNSRVLLF